MRAMRAAGFSLREIGETIGKHHETVKRILARG